MTTVKELKAALSNIDENTNLSELPSELQLDIYDATVRDFMLFNIQMISDFCTKIVNQTDFSNARMIIGSTREKAAGYAANVAQQFYYDACVRVLRQLDIANEDDKKRCADMLDKFKPDAEKFSKYLEGIRARYGKQQPLNFARCCWWHSCFGSMMAEFESQCEEIIN